MYQPSRERIERLTAIFRERNLREREQVENWTVEIQQRRVIRFIDRGLCERQRVKFAQMLEETEQQ